MRYFLLHPTHRKLIRLLRGRIDSGSLVIFTQSDLDAFNSLCQGQMTMIKRHQGIYRIVLTAVYRPIEEIRKDEKVFVVGDKAIRSIEKCFLRAELKNLGTTITGGYIVPALQWMLEKSKQRTRKRGKVNN